jgi:hypothetical protein
MRPPLCLWDSAGAPFGRYAVEMLQAEGLTGAEALDVSAGAVPPDALTERQALVIAPCRPATGAEAVALSALRAGTAVILLRPSADTAHDLGLTGGGGRRVAPELYIAPQRRHPLSLPVFDEPLQFHGAADLYDKPQPPAEVVAWVAGPDWPMPHPAIVTGTHGAGRFAVFAYDLASSVVLSHQGRPELASTGPTPDSDGDGVFAPSDLFQGFLDVNRRHIPQADLQQRLLVRLIAWASEGAGPLVRLWPFPDGAPAIALINGDSDGMIRAQLEWYVNMTEAHGGRYTIYVMEQHYGELPPGLATEYRRRGHSLGPHIWHSLRPDPDTFARHLAAEVDRFTANYGQAPRTTRHHCVVWPGWVDTAKALAAAGIRLETNYRAAERYQSGYLTGSGLPMRFIDQQGELVECFQQETLLCDDYLLVDKSFRRPLDEGEAIALSRKLLDDAMARYHTAVQLYFHPIYATGLMVRTGQFIRTAGWLEAVLKHCQGRGVPMPSTDTWCDFNVRRRGTVLAEQQWDGETRTLRLAIESAAGLPGAAILLPTEHDGHALARLRVGADDRPLIQRDVDGQPASLATTDLPPGRTEVIASYG